MKTFEQQHAKAAVSPGAVLAPGLSLFRCGERRIPGPPVPLLSRVHKAMGRADQRNPSTSQPMLICNRCSTSIPDGARFCPACGDPVTAGDLASRQAAPSSESVRLVCPHCEHPSLCTIPSHGVGQLTCPACGNAFDTRVVRVRSKRSTGQKQSGTRSFSVRVEDLEGREDFVEFVRPKNEDFELRSRDLAAFSSIQGRLTIVQNLSVDQHMWLVRASTSVQPGCAAAVLLWAGVVAGAGALVF
jgi:hypothetical protein